MIYFQVIHKIKTVLLLIVKNIKVWVDAEYAAGRVTVLTDDELIKVINEECDKLGISLK